MTVSCSSGLSVLASKSVGRRVGRRVCRLVGRLVGRSSRPPLLEPLSVQYRSCCVLAKTTVSKLTSRRSGFLFVRQPERLLDGCSGTRSEIASFVQRFFSAQPTTIIRPKPAGRDAFSRRFILMIHGDALRSRRRQSCGGSPHVVFLYSFFSAVADLT